MACGAPRGPEQRLSVALALTAHQGIASHLSAAWLLGLRDRAPSIHHLTTPLTSRYLPDGGGVHRTRHVPAFIIVRGFPCTDATRTLIDVAPLVPMASLVDMVDRALALQLTAVARIERALSATDRNRPGAGRLRRHLADRGLTGGPAPSVLESRATRLFHRAGLPEPVVQCEVSPDGRTYRLDYAYTDVAAGHRGQGVPLALLARAALQG